MLHTPLSKLLILVFKPQTCRCVTRPSGHLTFHRPTLPTGIICLAATMHLSLLLACLPLTVVLATPNGRCTGDKATGYWKESGICITTGNCRNRGGKTKDGACPSDGDDIKCCLIGVQPSDVNPCGEYSHCTWTSNGCAGGTWLSGKLQGSQQASLLTSRE